MKWVVVITRHRLSSYPCRRPVSFTIKVLFVVNSQKYCQTND